jgi:hypothetical protein
LSFAVGALLGDVFLHLLPEAFESELQRKGNILTLLCDLAIPPEPSRNSRIRKFLNFNAPQESLLVVALMSHGK